MQYRSLNLSVRELQRVLVHILIKCTLDTILILFKNNFVTATQLVVLPLQFWP